MVSNIHPRFHKVEKDNLISDIEVFGNFFFALSIDWFLFELFFISIVCFNHFFIKISFKLFYQMIKSQKKN